MNQSFVERDLADVSGFPDLFKIRKFYMRDVGLIRTTDLHFKMPLLEVLDLQDNRIFEVEAIDDLCNFTSLVEVNFSNNPVNVHANLQSMICDANPMLEVVNKRQVKEIGYREQQEILKIRREIIEYEQPTVGTTKGDRLLAEGLEDFEMNPAEMRKQLHRIDQEEENSGILTQDDLDRKIRAAKRKNELIQKVDEAL